ncbi:MAG: peptide ABC transporter [Alphaproteobacteria bacterium]|nr:peptide ABC transporter [Alphaproteobacteria bacterium]
MSSKRIPMVQAAAFAVAALAGTATGFSALAAQRDMVLAVPAITYTLDPMGWNSNVNERVSNNVIESLVEYDYEKNTFKPMLATSWKIVDDRTIEFTLRQGVKCHNGEDFDANDVAISLGPKRFLGEGAPGWQTGRYFFGNIKTIEVIDKYNVRLRSDIPDPLMLNRLSTWMSQMVCGDAYLAAKSWEEWGRTVVGTGPYRLAEMKARESHKLVAFDGYWGKKAPASSITFKVVPETAPRVAGLITGEYDVITEIVPDQFDTIEKSGKATISGGPVNNLRVILYDKRHPSLADPRMRQALSYAIDRKLIADTLFKGRIGIPHSLQMNTFDHMLIKEHKAIGYDPAKARQLAAAAGYKGEEIAYRYRQDYYTGEVQTAQILQAMWKAVGINVKLEMKESGDEITGAKALPGLGVFNISNGAYWNDPLGQIWRLYQPGGLIQGYKTWWNAEFDALGKDLLGTDKDKRRAAFAKMLEIYDYADPPGTTLHNFPLFYGVKKSVKWKGGLTGFMDFRADNLSFE